MSISKEQLKKYRELSENKWWNSTPKIINGKFLVVAIMPNGEETTELFTIEELESQLTQRATDGLERVALHCTCPDDADHPDCPVHGTSRQ